MCIYCESTNCRGNCSTAMNFANQQQHFDVSCADSEKQLEDTLRLSQQLHDEKKSNQLPTGILLIKKSSLGGWIAECYCPTCGTHSVVQIGKNNRGLWQCVDTTGDGFEAWMSGGNINDYPACATLQCSGSSLTLSAYQASTMNDVIMQDLPSYVDGVTSDHKFNDRAEKLLFLQTSFDTRDFVTGDQIPQHLNPNGREIIGISCPPFILQMNEDTPRTINQA